MTCSGLPVKRARSHRVLGGDAHRAGVEVALAHHHAAGRNQRRGGETELVGAEKGADHHVSAGTDTAIDLHGNAAAQLVADQRLVGFGQADFPGRTGVLERGQRAGARAAFVAGNGHMVGARLGDAGGHGAHADFGDELDRDQALRVDVLEVKDQLRQIFDRIDVVVRRRRDQADALGRVTHLGDDVVDLVTGQLAAFAGLCALRHLDLHHVGIDQVFRGHAEAARGHLLDGRAHGVAVRQRGEAIDFLTTFAGVGLPPMRFMAMASVVCASRLIEP